MVMDKGLGMNQARDLMETAAHLTDYIKLGFGTSIAGNDPREKIRLYRDNGIKVYVGGTLFEAFMIRGQADDYVRFLDWLDVDAAEISDGSIRMEHAQKCEWIEKLSKTRTVLSEIGAKDAGVVLEHQKWVEEMALELQAGSHLVIAEARESGTVGIYHDSGKADTDLISRILKEIPAEKIMWEAPIKSQQVWFINKLGASVNLGNIAPADIVPLETLRLGLRGDTFFSFLPEDLQAYKL